MISGPAARDGRRTLVSMFVASPWEFDFHRQYNRGARVPVELEVGNAAPHLTR